MALKYSVPFTLVRFWGLELVLPTKMSLTNIVPASVPSLFHSSRRWFRRSRGRQYAVHVREVLQVGGTVARPDALTSAVPRSVPSLFHSSLGWLVVSPEEQLAVHVRERTGAEPR